MARTKQSARQSTGDVAPRAKLAKPKPRVTARWAQDADDSDEYTPNAGKRKKRSTGNSLAQVPRDSDEPISAKRVRANPPRAVSIRARTSEVIEADVDEAEADADVDADAVSVSNANRLASAETPGRQTPDDGPLSDDKQLAADAAQHCAATVLPQPVVPLVAEDLSNIFCYACNNGGTSLGCDECDRTLCLKHIPEFAAIPIDVIETLHFRCPSCHVRLTRNDPECAPYYGLYKIGEDGTATEPYLSHWVLVDNRAARPQHAKVNTRPIVILSIRLVGLDEESCPARFLYSYLTTWFDGPMKSRLRYVDMPFNIINADHAKEYSDRWDEILTALGQFENTRIILFIYTHSHDGTGDLFFARRHCSVSVHDWWHNVVPAKLRDLARTESNELTIVMLACGAVITKERPQQEVRDLAADTGAKHMFTFAATHLQAVLTVPFFINFAQRVFLEGMDLKPDKMVTIFDQAMFLARHTAIWFFSRESLQHDLKVDVYDWTHLTMRPHGEDIGLQCPSCGSLSSRKGMLIKGEIIVVACKKQGCSWSKVFKPATTGIKPLTLGENGRWRRREVVIPKSMPVLEVE